MTELDETAIWRAPRLLLVEGQSDKHFVIHISKKSSVLPDFEIKVCGSVDSLTEIIIPALDVEQRVALGILVDANSSLEARWQDIADELCSVDIEVPNHPDPDGTVIEGTERIPRIGIWILPDNRTEGELETLFADMIRRNDPIWPLANTYIDKIPVCSRPFVSSKIKVNKAKVYAWLATRRKPGLIGIATGSGQLDSDIPIAKSFLRWLGRTFR